MRFRLLVLIAIELAVVVFLGLQVTAAPAVATQSGTPAPAVAPPPTATEPGTVTGQPEHIATDAAAPAPAQRTEVQTQWNADDPVSILLAGTVHWSDGTRVEETNVYLSQDREHRDAAGGKDGSYAVVGLTPGTWRLTVRNEGAVEQSQDLEVTYAALQELEVRAV